MSKHIPNKKQEDAFNAVVKAIKAANKAGLVFYAKSSKLTAYTKQADDYVENEHGFEKCLHSRYGQIFNLSANIIVDSGADDYPSYVSQEDAEKYNPNNY